MSCREWLRVVGCVECSAETYSVGEILETWDSGDPDKLVGPNH
jgi:hypothetical protein